MRVSCVLAAALLVPIGASAAGWQAPASPAGQTTPPPAGQGAPVPPATGKPADPAGAPGAPTLPPLAARTFAAPAGLLFNAVRADRVDDFEKVLAYLQAALDKSTDPTIRAQAKGWKIFKATEPGPNGTVLYVFRFDPTVPGADYGLGRILADAYSDAAQLQEIWRLYQGAVTSGGSLLNLTPVTPAPAPPPPAIAPGAGATTPRQP